MTTVERIKEISKKYGLTLKTTAIKAGLSENAIYKWNNQKPNSEALSAVAKVLNVSVDYLLGNTDEPTPNKNAVPTEETLDQALDHSISYDGKEITDHDRKLLKAMLTSYFENKDDNSK